MIQHAYGMPMHAMHALLILSQILPLNCLPVTMSTGFVLKKDQKKINAEDMISLEDLIEKEVSKSLSYYTIFIKYARSNYSS